MRIAEKTVITDPPTDDTATAGTDITLTCGISVDPSETSTVTVTWTKDGEEVSDDSRYSQDPHTHSLHIMPVAVSDSGRFKCHVKASMDEAEAEASLLIQGWLIKLILHCQYSYCCKMPQNKICNSHQ